MTTSTGRLAWLVPIFVCLISALNGVAWQQELEPPSFATMPPQLVEFSNMTGKSIPCSSSVSLLSEKVSWLGADGHTLKLIPGLREVLQDGTLMFPPFKAEDFRQDVHSTFYKCSLTNALGTIVSNDVTVKAVVLQPYDVYVYDAFAMKGSTAVLKCHVPKVISTYVTVTSWIRDSAEIISDGGLVKDSRFHVIPSGELFIQDVTASDDRSVFGCRVTNKLTGEVKASITSGKLFVTDPQGNVPPKITFTKKVILTETGKNTLLPCEAQAHPMPNISWYRTSDLGKHVTLPLKGRYSLVSGSLLIQDVHQSDFGTYFCISSNVAGSERAEVQLIINAPPVVTVNPASLIVDNGKSAMFSCNVIGNSVTAIKWMKDGKPLNEIPSIEILNNSSFRIITVSTEHKGIYQCFAKNGFQEAYAVSTLKMGDSPPVVLSGFEERVTESGVSVVLECIFSGSPTPVATWFFNGQTLPRNFIQKESVNSEENIVSTISIEQIRRQDGGVYSCHATNKAGEAAHNARINVYGKLGSQRRTKLTAVNGDTVALNCPFYGYPYSSVHWGKDGRSLPRDLHQKLMPNNSLIIRNLQRTSDSGIYICTVGYMSEIVRSEIDLAVMVPPKLAPFTFQDELVREGMRGRLQCVVLEGDLPITLKWLKDGQPIASSLELIIRDIDEFSSILTIAAITPRHNGNYTCSATNPAATVTFTAPLAVNVPPKIVPFFFQDDQLVEGMLIRVSCVVSRGDLPLTITWLKDDQPIPSERSITTRVFDEYSSVLSIDPVSRNHNGNYTCIARNHAATASHTAELKVQVPPKWTIEPKDITTKSGDNIYLHCRAEGLPEPVISWMWAKDYRTETTPIMPGANKIIMRNGTIVLKGVTKDQEGFYFCSASNGVGRPLSTSIMLRILAPPVFEANHKLITGRKGENLTLVCSAVGDQPITFFWSVENNMFINPNKDPRYVIKDANVKNKSSGQSELIITWLDRKDSKTYNCQAENEYGKDEMKFSVTVQDIPDHPTLLSAKASNRSVLLSWNTSFDGNSPITKFIVEYKKQVDSWHTRIMNLTSPGDAASMVVSGLQPAITYDFRIRAQNSVGLGTFSNTLAGTTEEDIPGDAPLNVEVESTDQHTLRVTWKPPRKSHWNGAIRGYKIGFKVDSSLDDYIFRNLEVPDDYTEDLIFQLTELKMFTQYNVIVQAYNTKGEGPPSEPIVSMTSEDVPSTAPQGIRCSALSSKSIYVLWEQPAAETVNGIIRGFKLLYKPVSEWYDSAVRVKTSSTTKITLQELEVNTNYTIQVLAFTKVGDGVKSSPIFCKTHEDVPESPQEIKVLPSSSDSVVVAWKAPKNSHGGITKYSVYYKPLEHGHELNPSSDNDDGVALMTEQVTNDASSHTSRSDNQFLEVKGLKKNKKYAFWVTASSIIGEGPSSKVMAQTVADNTVPAKSASFDGTIKAPWKKDVVLPCKAVGVPPPQRKWMIGDKPIEIEGRNILLSDGTLLINKVSSEDSANYTCAIYNEHGKDVVKYSLIVQVPPAAPFLDIISKHRSSIELQWKSGPDGGEKVKGYILHYRSESSTWETKELSPDLHFYTLDGLACGTTYQLYLEALNTIGTGPPCDILTVSTEGSEFVNPSKDSIIREGSTFVTVHLEAWPSTGCPVEKFHVEYKPMHTKEWTLVSDSLRPSQKKLVLPGLAPATWYAMRLTAETNGKDSIAEYKFATLTTTGGTIPPPEIRIEHTPEPVYLFYLDPYIFIPSVALLIIVIIASVIICICVKRKSGSLESPSDSDTTINTWSRRMHPGSFGNSQYPTMTHRGSKDLNPYATARLPDCILQHPCSDAFLGHSAPPQAWGGTLGRRPIHLAQGVPGNSQGFQSEFMQQAGINGEFRDMQETTFVFPASNQPNFTPNKGKPRPDEDYDQPPIGI